MKYRSNQTKLHSRNFAPFFLLFLIKLGQLVVFFPKIEWMGCIQSHFLFLLYFTNWIREILLWFLFSNWKRLIAPTSILFEASFLHVYFCAISSFIFQRKYNKMDQSKHTHRHTELSSFCKSRRIFTILHGRHINDCKEKDKISQLGK